MGRLLPGRVEVALFAAVAVSFALIITQVQSANRDLFAAAMCIPVFIVAAVLGLRRSPQWQPVAEIAPERAEESINA